MTRDVMEHIREKAALRSEKVKTRQRERYQLAKVLGFNSSEAALLAGWGVERIKALAETRKTER